MDAPTATKLYSIRGWAKHYEKAQTRKVSKAQWVPLPVKHDGKSFRRLMSMKNGVAIYGAWVLLIQIAAKCQTRGVLADEDGPLTAEDLSFKTGCPEGTFEAALQVLSSQSIGWIVVSDYHNDINAMERHPDPLQLQDRTGQDITTPKSPKGDRGRFQSKDVPIPDGWSADVVRPVLADWLGHKRSLGKPYKSAATAGRLLAKFAKDHGADGQAQFLAAVEHSIAMNYAGCFPPSDPKAKSAETFQQRAMTSEELREWKP